MENPFLNPAVAADDSAFVAEDVLIAAPSFVGFVKEKSLIIRE